MRYIDVIWLHESQEEPYRLVSEVSADNYELRKLEFFRSGFVGVASTTMNTEKTMLGSAEVPAIEEINANSEFQGKDISKQEFDNLWSKYAAKSP